MTSGTDFAAAAQSMADQRETRKGNQLLDALTSQALTGPKGKAEKPEPEPVTKPDPARQLANPYSSAVMIELMVANPGWTHTQFASHFGHTPSWFASVLASDEFQLALDPRRHEINNPSITATFEERFRALTIRSLEVLSVKMDAKKVEDSTVLKAAELGIKALGIGLAKKDDDGKGKLTGVQKLDDLASRLTELLASKGQGKGMIPVYPTTNEQRRVEALSPSDVLIAELDGRTIDG